MGKGKLAKFADMERYENVFQYPFSVVDNVPFITPSSSNWVVVRGNIPLVLVNSSLTSTSSGWISRAHECGPGQRKP